MVAIKPMETAVQVEMVVVGPGTGMGIMATETVMVMEQETQVPEHLAAAQLLAVV